MTPQQALDLFRLLVDFFLGVIPADVAHKVIDDAAVRRSNEFADLAEDAKFGPEKP